MLYLYAFVGHDRARAGYARHRRRCTSRSRRSAQSRPSSRRSTARSSRRTSTSSRTRTSSTRSRRRTTPCCRFASAAASATATTSKPRRCDSRPTSRAGSERGRGCVEIGLHVAAPHAAARSGRSGTRLHAAAPARPRPSPKRWRRTSMRRSPSERVRRHAQPQRRNDGAASRARTSSRAHDVESFRAAVDEAQRRHGELSFACTGPWPPYSFAVARDAKEPWRERHRRQAAARRAATWRRSHAISKERGARCRDGSRPIRRTSSAGSRSSCSR